MKCILLILVSFNVFSVENTLQTNTPIQASQLNENFSKFYISGYIEDANGSDIHFIEDDASHYATDTDLRYYHFHDNGDSTVAGILCDSVENDVNTGSNCNAENKSELVGLYVQIPHDDRYRVCFELPIRHVGNYGSVKMVKVHNNLSGIITTIPDNSLNIKTLYSSTNETVSHVNLCNVYNLTQGKHSFALRYTFSSTSTTSLATRNSTTERLRGVLKITVEEM